MNFTIGQRISTRGEDFIITNTNVNYDGTFLIEAEGISELVKGKQFSFDSSLDTGIKPVDTGLTNLVADTGSGYGKSIAFSAAQIPNAAIFSQTFSTALQSGQLDKDSHKSAYEITRILKEGIIHAVEALANEALYYKKEILKESFDETDNVFEQQVKDDSLKIIYRLLFIFYAESRTDLDILPSNNNIYQKGYSLEMLRNLEQTPLYSDSNLNGYFFHESLGKLFYVLSSGYREKENGRNRSFKVRHIDSLLFNDATLHQLAKVKFRNKVWQFIICRLSLSKPQKGKSAERISYAHLGINQLGSVYENLLAYRGFYAEQDYMEVHKANKPNEGTYLVPRNRRTDFEENEILKDESEQVVILPKGSFVYRFIGRDRQKSASFYTPEVLTQCTVKYTLKPILEKLDKGEMKALELLELKLLEPAMGAAAFHNETINQLAETYLSYRQKELKKSGQIDWRVQPEMYKVDLQKIKAYIATNNVYGVDLNPTAIELGKLSLWLNVIHKDMETPFFSNRLAVGNAVAGAWLKVYKEKDVLEEYEIIKNTGGKEKKVLINKEWWETAPRQLEFKATMDQAKIMHGRSQDEIYHFLLPDKNMAPGADNKILKKEHDKKAKVLAQWRKEWIAPLKESEAEQLKNICNKIDELLVEHYRFQRTIDLQTSCSHKLFGAEKKDEAGTMHSRSYAEKVKLTDQRNQPNTPYFKLKMVMDYWCSLWFWDIRKAQTLPTRLQYWQDIAKILEPDAAKTPDLFDSNYRLEYVRELANKYFFFHPQLAFLEVFWERGGFDLIIGNPPWISISLDDKEFVGDYKPETFIRKTTAAKARKSLKELLFNSVVKNKYLELHIESTSMQAFLSVANNYHLLKGQRNNLYKNVLCNCLSSINKNGSWGLIYPQTIYEDPDGGILRSKIFKYLKYHYHFINQALLFSEIDNQVSYSINIFRGAESDIKFDAIFNLFHPFTIERCYFKNHKEDVALKVKTADGKYTWNLTGSKERIISVNSALLSKISGITEHASGDFNQTNLIRLHTNTLMPVLEKIKKLKNRIKDENHFITDGLNDTTTFDNHILVKGFVNNPDLDDLELVFAGPNFYISTPWYKSIRKGMKSNRDYDSFVLSLENEHSKPNSASKAIAPTVVRNAYTSCIHKDDSWLDHFKLAFSKMLNLGSMRTLQSSILPPNVPHVSNAISIILNSSDKLIELCGLTSSIVYDFYIKTLGKENLYPETIEQFRMGLNKKFLPFIASRVLRMNCQTAHFANLWTENYSTSFLNDRWCKADPRLNGYSELTKEYNFNYTPFKNDFERRFALVELDVIVALALNLSLDDLIGIYKICFPVNQQYEDNTFYDVKGSIVFTINKGLPDVGVERSVWERICNFSSGEIYEHTITKSELYHGKKITYHAPFKKSDRVEDYTVAWEHFENVFKPFLKSHAPTPLIQTV